MIKSLKPLGAALLLAGCSQILRGPDEPPKPVPPLVGHGVSRYRIHVVYFDQDDVGFTRKISEIKAQVDALPTEDGTGRFRWSGYRIREYPAPAGCSIETLDALPAGGPAWKPVEYAEGFGYSLPGDALDTFRIAQIDSLRAVPRDMDGSGSTSTSSTSTCGAPTLRCSTARRRSSRRPRSNR